MLKINDTKYFSPTEVKQIVQFIRTQYSPYITLPYQEVIFRDVLGMKINESKFYSISDIHKIIAFMKHKIWLESLKSRYTDLREMVFEAVENYVFTRNTGKHIIKVQQER